MESYRRRVGRWVPVESLWWQPRNSTLAYAEFYNLSLHFHEVHGANKAKITGKVTKYQRESCIVLLQSEIKMQKGDLRWQNQSWLRKLFVLLLLNFEVKVFNTWLSTKPLSIS